MTSCVRISAGQHSQFYVMRFAKLRRATWKRKKMMHIEIDEQIDVPSSNDDTPVILQPGSTQWHDIHNNELIVLQEVDAEYLSNGQKQSVKCEI